MKYKHKIILPIDPFQLTQGFGENPESYKQFGLKGHNGWDIRTIYSDTPAGRRYILAPQKVQFYSQGNEGSYGYGLYFEVVTKAKTYWKHTFAHCHSIESFTEKEQGDHMAISDHTGNSTDPHLHWTVKRIKIINGKHEVQNYNNGYFGAVNPQEYIDEVRSYNGTEPMTETQITIEGSLYEKLVNKSSKWDDVVKYLDLTGDSANISFEDAKRVIAGMKSRITDIQNQLSTTSSELENKIEQVSRLKEQLIDEQKLYEALNDKLKQTIDAQLGSNKVYEDRITVLQGQIDEVSKQLGKAKNDLASCEAGQPQGNSLWDVIKEFLSQFKK